MANWTRDQLLLALNLYHQTPFGKQHSSYPPIVELANQIGRTPSAVAMKLSNFTFLDPAENGKGLSGASRNDRSIWEESYGELEALAEASEPLIEGKEHTPVVTTEIDAQVKQRRHQSFFRKAVLGSYGNRCCISGMSIPKLLRASHIVPWSVSEENRLNPSNGLCLAGTYDLAFDQFLITFDEQNRLLIGNTLKEESEDKAVVKTFLDRAGQSLLLPEKNLPRREFLAWHRAKLC